MIDARTPIKKPPTGPKPAKNTIFIHADIAPGLASYVIDSIAVAGNEPLLLRINCKGGSWDEATAVYNVLAAHRPGVKVQIEGACHGPALLFLALGKVTCGQAVDIAPMNPKTAVYGDSCAIIKAAEQLGKQAEFLISLLSKKTLQSPATIRQWLAEQRHFTAREALENGLVDIVADPDSRASPENRIGALQRKIFAQVSGGAC